MFGRGKEIHEIGSVWTTMLLQVYFDLVQEFNYSSDIFNSKSNAGNIVFLHLMIGGLMIQPCNPSFLDARNAIMEVDRQYFDGIHYCVIYKGFAKKGLGYDAMQSIEGFDVPPECQSNDKSNDENNNK